MDVTTLKGPVERVGEELVLRIPLSAGGSELIACSRGIGNIDGDYLTVTIRPWLAERLHIVVGTIVDVDNAHGKFNIRRAADQTAE
jgi:hypothetical protein